MSVTIKDIARIAGVTHSTVSRCLNDKPGVSESMRKEIKKIAEDLGFEFNANARGLNTSKTGTIGIILNEADDNSQPHFFTNAFLGYIRRQLEEQDLDTLTTFYQNIHSGKDNIQKLVSRRKVDGLIILSSTISLESIDFLNAKEIPFIFSHQIPPEGAENINAVYCDHYMGGYLAGRHLAEKGRRRVLCLSREENRAEFSLRTQGCIAALSESGISLKPGDIVPVKSDLNSGPALFDRLKPRLHEYDAVFAHTDLIALVLMKELERNGINVPSDIAVIGYDNIQLSSFFEPGLTSISQPSREISIKTCEILINLLSGECGRQRHILAPSLVVRESA